jgi:Mn2+/Fe2+ NRAMP family transporter
MIASTIVAVGMNFIGLNTFSALFVSALINGLLAPPLLLLLMLLANSRSVMHGKVNGPLLNIVGWATTVVMSVAAVGVLITTFS